MNQIKNDISRQIVIRNLLMLFIVPLLFGIFYIPKGLYDFFHSYSMVFQLWAIPLCFINIACAVVYFIRSKKDHVKGCLLSTLLMFIVWFGAKWF